MSEQQEGHRELTWCCCFCGEDADPAIQIVAIWNWSDAQNADETSEQYFFSHPACFIDRLHERVRVFPWNDDDWEVEGTFDPKGE